MSTKQRINCWNYEGVKYYLDITLTDCCVCGVTLAMPADYEQRRREDHASFYCLNGHQQAFKGETAQEKKLRLAEAEAAEERRAREASERSLAYARTALTAARDQAAMSERSKAAYKGHLTRMRNRIANGVCPVQSCQRSFQNVHQHITKMHPEWAHEHPEALA
jgi:hypothetical protein